MQLLCINNLPSSFLQCKETYTRGGRGGSRDCTKTCNSTELECYVIDNNGFIVISEQKENTGKFFGEVDGTIFESLIQHDIYRPITIYDYQAICLEMADDGSPASTMLTVSYILIFRCECILCM